MSEYDYDLFTIGAGSGGVRARPSANGEQIIIILTHRTSPEFQQITAPR